MSEREDVVARFESDAAGAAWEVRRARYTEGLGTSYVLEVELVTDAMDAEPVRLLGQAATVTLARGAAERRIPGVVAMLEEGEEHGHYVGVTLELRPALEALRYRTNTRIFQDQSAPDILEEVLSEGLAPHGRAVELRLARTYPTAEYRVQYDETDLSFCERLMEEEGIVCFFDMEGDAELLVLVDEPTEYGAIESIHGSPIELLDRSGGAIEGREAITELTVRSAVRPSASSTRHYDWRRPSTLIEEASSDQPPEDGPHGAYVDPPREVYEHDLHPLTFDAGGANDAAEQIRLRREALAHDGRVLEGTSTVLAMRPGANFEAIGHELPELDRGYLVLSVTHELASDGRRYENRFRCIPDDMPYRPPRRTPRPRIDGALSARVTGPSGEEIHPDGHGRIRVQFPWDREGAMDERSTRWVRVMQPWAGAGWGHLFIPRIGMDVLIEFLDGDPDRPICVGAAYDGEHPPPYVLPDDKTKSTIKTQSSLGGSGDNELRFEDLAAAEEIYLHAQKDLDEVVENDHTTTVHHDQAISVDHDQSQEVGNDQTEHVFANQTLTVDANRSITVHGSYTETVDGSETRTVSSGVSETIDAGETRTVTGGMTESITGGRTQTIDGSSDETIVGSLSQSVSAGITITTPAAYDITAVGGLELSTPASISIVAPGGYQLLAPGGQTTMDAELLSTGALWYDSYLFKVARSVYKQVDVAALHLQFFNVHLIISGFLFQTGGAWIGNQGVQSVAATTGLRAWAGRVGLFGLNNRT